MRGIVPKIPFFLIKQTGILNDNIIWCRDNRTVPDELPIDFGRYDVPVIQWACPCTGTPGTTYTP